MSAEPRTPSPVTGHTLVEVTLASSILAILFFGTLAWIASDARGLGPMAEVTMAGTRGQELIDRIEQELMSAGGFRPQASLTADAGPLDTRLLVTATAGFPDRGSLLLDRGTAAEERVRYDALLPTLDGFTSLARGVRCTRPAAHLFGQAVLWAPLGEALDTQINPLPGSWDGRSLQLGGPLYFRGEGTGFVFRVPVDPAGGRVLLAGGGPSWGAVVAGQPTLDGWSALYFEPDRRLSETEVGADLNADGDSADAFDVGQIRMRTWNGADPNVPARDVGLGPRIVLQEECNWGSDLDGDGFDDPIFLWEGARRQLHLRLSLVTQVHVGIVIQRAESCVFLRNSPLP